MLIPHGLEHKEYKITLGPIKTEGPQACLLPRESGIGAQFHTENLEGTCFLQHGQLTRTMETWLYLGLFGSCELQLSHKIRTGVTATTRTSEMSNEITH